MVVYSENGEHGTRRESRSIFIRLAWSMYFYNLFDNLSVNFCPHLALPVSVTHQSQNQTANKNSPSISLHELH